MNNQHQYTISAADYAIFDFLSQYRWPSKTPEEIASYRSLIESNELKVDAVLEHSLALCSENSYERIDEYYRDFSDGSDAKKAVTQHRQNDKKRNQWTNSARISKVINKQGLLRCLVYSRFSQQIYFFAIPQVAYQGRNSIDIIFDQSVGYKEPKGIPVGKWTRCQVKDFKTLATITHKQAEQLWMDYENTATTSSNQ